MASSLYYVSREYQDPTTDTTATFVHINVLRVDCMSSEIEDSSFFVAYWEILFSFW